MNIPVLSSDEKDSFFKKIVKDTHWIWLGGPQFRIGQLTFPPKRIIWSLFLNQNLNPNDIVQNNCGVENCIHPEHLIVVKRGHHGCVRKPEEKNDIYPLAPNQPILQGTTTTRPINQLSVKQLNNFFKKVNKTDDCWLWTGHKTPTGRGKLKLYGTEHTAPRISYAIQFGIDPGNFYVLHVCDNASCVNPEHLYLGTAQDNMNDMLARGQFKPSYGNTKIQLDSNEEAILLDSTIPITEVAKMLNIHRKTVWERRKQAGIGTSLRGRTPGVWKQ